MERQAGRPVPPPCPPAPSAAPAPLHLPAAGYVRGAAARRMDCAPFGVGQVPSRVLAALGAPAVRAAGVRAARGKVSAMPRGGKKAPGACAACDGLFFVVAAPGRALAGGADARAAPLPARVRAVPDGAALRRKRPAGLLAAYARHAGRLPWALAAHRAQQRSGLRARGTKPRPHSRHETAFCNADRLKGGHKTGRGVAGGDAGREGADGGGRERGGGRLQGRGGQPSKRKGGLSTTFCTSEEFRQHNLNG